MQREIPRKNSTSSPLIKEKVSSKVQPVAVGLTVIKKSSKNFLPSRFCLTNSRKNVLFFFEDFFLRQ